MAALIVAAIGPSTNYANIVKADADLPGTTRGFWIGTGGNLTVHRADGTSVTIPDLPSGILLNMAVIRVTTATTASDIVAIY